MEIRTVETTAPPIGLSDRFIRMAIVGVAGLAAWEIFARLLAPLFLGEALDPTPLIEMSIGVSGWRAEAVHLVTAVAFFPVGYLLIFRPIVRRLIPDLSWPFLGVAYGVGLWILAMYVIASLVLGMPPFLGFQAVAWASLVGHVALALAIAGVSRALLPRSL